MDKSHEIASRITLVPVIPGVPTRPVIQLARAVSGGGRTIVLSVVEVPAGHSLSEGVSVARRRRELLRRIGDEFDPDSLELAVRAARSFDEGVREAVQEHGVTHLLLGWRGPLRSERRLRTTSVDQLVLNPPCDLTVIRLRRQARTGVANAADVWPPSRVLLAVRGGPHAELALALARSVAAEAQAPLTVLRVKRDSAEDDLFAAPPFRDVEVITVENESVAAAISSACRSGDLLIMGASARGERSTHLLGLLPERVADSVGVDVMVVKTGEALRPEMFGITATSMHAVSAPDQATISTIVDQWFAENTFHSHEFEDLDQLVAFKQRQEQRISVVLPALNEAATIGKIISTIKQRMMTDHALVDELVVIDSDSTDDTVAIAESLGVSVVRHRDVLSETGSFTGKGEGLWKSLYVTSGDIVVWIDSDITDLHPKFVYGLVGPLLTQPRLEFVKGYYRRPLNLGGELLTTGGGRVTELTARPLINLFYPLLSGLVQPLAGEMAGRRSLLEQLPFFTGYGVETGLLIDILERHGIDSIAQTDLENRIHRNQDMISLSKMAFAIVQVVMRRLEDRQHIRLVEDINTTMKLIHYSPDELFLEVKEIQEHERPPIAGLEQYARRSLQTDRVGELSPA